MTFHILPASGIPITAGTVQHITHIEQQTDLVQQRMNDYTIKIADKFKEGRLHQDGDKPVLQEWEDLLEEDPDFAAEFNRLFENTEVPEADDPLDLIMPYQHQPVI